jgi:predicted 2-oxoglutarate/Fe(II)-dependent dioxygenase YbiX
MPPASFFAPFGLYCQPEFLPGDLCAELYAAMQTGARKTATVQTHASDREVDRKIRSTQWVTIPDDLLRAVTARLETATDTLARHYNVALTGPERPQFLSYSVGDFYKPHRDASHAHDAGERYRARKVSAVIFVNGQAPDPRPDAYGGGALTFFELFDDPTGKAVGFPLDPTPGLLATFPSDRLHSVAPVTHGERFTVVTWFF